MSNQLQIDSMQSTRWSIVFAVMVFYSILVLTVRCDDDHDNINCTTNKDCDKTLECALNKCQDPCRKSPCGTNAICKVGLAF